MKYRKRPVVIDAEVYRRGLEDGFECTVDDIQCRPGKLNRCYHLECYDNLRLAVPYIETLEGKHCITEGDYIITGVKGERYPCKPEIFHMTYEEVQ